MSLIAEIQDKCSPELIASKEHGEIARIVSIGRTKQQATAIGKGTILSVLGMTAGNAFLDVIDTAPDYRHVKDIIKNSLFDVSLSVSHQGIDAMVPAVLTQEQADALKALGTVPAPVSVSEVIAAMEGM